MTDDYVFETIQLSRVGKKNNVAHVELNRPKSGNTMNGLFFREYRECFQKLSKDTSFRAIIISGRGKYFCVGLDLKDSNNAVMGGTESDVGRKSYALYNEITNLQASMSAPEYCPQPVIVCMHNACIGGAIDLSCAADIRMCTKDSWFSIKEVDIGLAADIGTLQRIQRVIGSSSLARELCYTARKMYAEEAKTSGYVSSVYQSQEEMLASALKMAEEIASKSPVAIASTKANLNFSRDHSIRDSLQFQSIWNASMLQTEDIPKAAAASLMKQEQPEFSKL